MQLLNDKLKVILFIIFISIIIIGNEVLNYQASNNSDKKIEWVNHTQEVIIETKDYLNALKDAETGQRGYLLTTDINYLEPYNKGVIKTQQSILKLKQLTSDNKTQQNKIKQLDKLMKLKLEELAITISLTQIHNDNNKALELVKQNHGKEYMDKIRLILDKFIKEEIVLLENRKKDLKEQSDINTNIIRFIAITVLLILFYFLYITINQKKKLQVLNDTLNQKVKDAVEKNKQQDIKLHEQLKLAARGEMIGNIAHQWRQPLSVISSAATGLTIKKEHKILTDETFNETCKLINENAQYLSITIDDFKNFIKGERKRIKFNLNDNINSFLHLIEGSIKNNDIHIIQNNQDSIMLSGYPNELIQCFINIFNNSKDVLIDLDNDRFIFITTSTKDNKVIITLKDNAGGIKEDILPRIFEPYFTTKHQSQGTGLGLHMTYNLIVEGMDGTIEANNVSYEYEGKKYVGAVFTITLPLD